MSHIPRNSRTRAFIPALNRRWLTPLYDPLIRWTMREDVFKPALVQQAQILPGHRVLDLGCGTATLTILIKQRHPEATVLGVDIDPRILSMAREKIARAGVEIPLDEGAATELPYPDETFDRILSSLVFHHLCPRDKLTAAREAFRVLRPGGTLHVADFGPPQSALMAVVTLWMRYFEETRDHFAGRLSAVFGQAGFTPVEVTWRYSTFFGPLALYRARRPA